MRREKKLCPEQGRSSRRARTLYAVKRLIGRKFDEKEVQKDSHLMPYKVGLAERKRTMLARRQY